MWLCTVSPYLHQLHCSPSNGAGFDQQQLCHHTWRSVVGGMVKTGCKAGSILSSMRPAFISYTVADQNVTTGESMGLFGALTLLRSNPTASKACNM